MVYKLQCITQHLNATKQSPYNIHSFIYSALNHFKTTSFFILITKQIILVIILSSQLIFIMFDHCFDFMLVWQQSIKLMLGMKNHNQNENHQLKMFYNFVELYNGQLYHEQQCFVLNTFAK